MPTKLEVFSPGLPLYEGSIKIFRNLRTVSLFSKGEELKKLNLITHKMFNLFCQIAHLKAGIQKSKVAPDWYIIIAEVPTRRRTVWPEQLSATESMRWPGFGSLANKPVVFILIADSQANWWHFRQYSSRLSANKYEKSVKKLAKSRFIR